MQKYLRQILVFIIVACVATTALAQRKQPEPKIMAVYFYANWCGNCKVLAPKFEEAIKNGKLDSKDVLFVKLDLSDKATIHQAILHAQALGIGDYLTQQGSATGYVAILDAKTKKELKRFDKESSAEDIEKGIGGLL